MVKSYLEWLNRLKMDAAAGVAIKVEVEGEVEVEVEVLKIEFVNVVPQGNLIIVAFVTGFVV